MVQVFTDVKIQPAYGFNQVLIQWSLLPSYQSAKIYVYRSPDGVEFSEAWELLNENTPVQNLNFYVDSTLKDDSKFRMYHYRLVALLNEDYYDSPVVGMFSEGLSKKEYGILRFMRKSEYLRMRSKNGIRVLHCIPAISGTYSMGTDEILLARTYPPCKDGDRDDPELYEGIGLFSKEFSSITQTWAEIISIGEVTATPNEDSPGNTITQQYKLRMLGFPCPGIGHMIVLPHTDKRLAITNNINPFLFKGYLPVAYEVVAEEIEHSESRYKIPLPQLLPDPEYPTTTIY